MCPSSYLLISASKAARIIAKEKAHEALIAEDNSKPWYIKYPRKAYRAAMHGMEVDVHEASARPSTHSVKLRRPLF